MASPTPLDPLARWLLPFADTFTAPTWRSVLVLVAGTLLAPGRRTVTAALIQPRPTRNGPLTRR